MMFVFLSVLMTCSYVYAATTYSAKFSWLPDNSEDLTGYKIYYGLSDGGPYPNVAVFNKNTTPIVIGRVQGNVKGLAAGQLYYFVSTTYSDSGSESTYSGQVAKTACAEPNKIIGLRVINAIN